MENEVVAMFTDLFSSVGMWAVFAYLFVQERKAHEATRRQHNEDLREIAGLTKPLTKAPPAPLHETSP